MISLNRKCESMAKEFNASIELAGFRDVDSSSMMIITANIDTHARKLSSRCKKMEKLHVTMKKIHEREKGEKYDIHAKIIDNGKVYTSQVVDRNLIAAIDEALEKLTRELE